MRIAIASGKGGTGKTTVATNLALSLQQPVWLLDCDVEEPNCHIFLKPVIESSSAVEVPVPEVDASACTGCGACSRICRFKAIAMPADKPLIFPELCHSCGGCALVCPVDAITEVPREVGRIDAGRRGEVRFVQGLLNVGEAMAPPVIRAVKRSVVERDGTLIVDAPPGASCPVIEAIRGADFVVLVTEPTPFGLNDLRLAVEMVRELGFPFGVVINRSTIGDARVRDYCESEDIEVLAELPDDRRIAEAYSRGEVLVEAIPGLREQFEALFERIEGARAAR